jgi:CheY-like chemotaxis protein/HPt (histidine-containing phosphotransfer) domain-containing protein
MTAAPAAPFQPHPGRNRVLVVEDNVVNQQLVLAMLSRAGFVAEVAADGQQALELLRAQPFDVVLMDLQMPVMDGLQATREIRRRGSGVLDPAIPVIAVTANAFAEDRARSFESGMNDFLTKPLDPRRLLEALARWAPSRPHPARTALPASGDVQVVALPEDDAESAPPSGLPADLEAVAVLDRVGLLERAMDDADLAGDLLDAFVHEYPAMRQALRDAIGRADPLAILNLAHTLKGAAANVGALRVCLVATRLEHEAAADAPTRLGDRFLELDRHLVEFERAVAALRAAGGPGSNT